jgi:hypothetical protein
MQDLINKVDKLTNGCGGEGGDTSSLPQTSGASIMRIE